MLREAPKRTFEPIRHIVSNVERRQEVVYELSSV